MKQAGNGPSRRAAQGTNVWTGDVALASISCIVYLFWRAERCSISRSFKPFCSFPNCQFSQEKNISCPVETFIFVQTVFKVFMWQWDIKAHCKPNSCLQLLVVSYWLMSTNCVHAALEMCLQNIYWIAQTYGLSPLMYRFEVRGSRKQYKYNICILNTQKTCLTRKTN